MFKWYLWAGVCYAYLSDVPSSEDPKGTTSAFRDSLWFKRGWTLQELLAPPVVYFFGSDWKEIGSRQSLQHLIANITRIDLEFFKHGKLSRYSVAQKMSWAANRQTTRIEDKAYCLMGIFNVNMPLLYGEGLKAFRRLQEEILRQSDDYSILVNDAYFYVRSADFLATTPDMFASSGSVRTTANLWSKITGWNKGATLTNRGLEITLPMVPTKELDVVPQGVSQAEQSKMAILNCQQDGKLVGMYLWEEEPGVYVRGRVDTSMAPEQARELSRPFIRFDVTILTQAKLEHILLLRKAYNPIVRIRRFSVMLSCPSSSFSCDSTGVNAGGFQAYWLIRASNTLSSTPPRPVAPFVQDESKSENANDCSWKFPGGSDKVIGFKDGAEHAFVLALRSGWENNGWTFVTAEIYPDTDLGGLLPAWKDKAGQPVVGSELVRARQTGPDGPVIVQAVMRKYRDDWKVIVTIEKDDIRRINVKKPPTTIRHGSPETSTAVGIPSGYSASKLE